MKDQLSVIIFVVAMIFLGFRLYQRYFNKNAGKNVSVKKPEGAFPSSVKDDDYEPYAKK